ncbi:MAG TPA: ATP-binding protein, partial [Haliangium sp.]|nr:ATP-binding protein [Haliangium sp.]
MPSVPALVELAERYAALGLSAAARGALLRAMDADPRDATAARHLAELALSAGDGAAACRHARDVVAREPGPGARVLLGRAQLAAGEPRSARFSFVAALEAASAPLVRARAHLGLSAVALAEGDRAGAGANAMAALDDVLGHVEALIPAGAAPPSDQAGDHPARPRLDRGFPDLAMLDEIFARIVEAGRAGDSAARIDEATVRPEAPVDLLRALLLAARQAYGDSSVGDAEIERAMLRAMQQLPGVHAIRLRLIERRLGRRHQDRAARLESLAELEAMVRDLADRAASPARNLELARACFLLAGAHEDDPGGADRAEALYRQGLSLQPGHTAAANRLALITLGRGDGDAALAEIARALRIDPAHGWTWRSAARTLDASSHGPDTAERVGRLLDAAAPGTGIAAPASARLMTAAAEVARDNVLAGMYARGHRVKNLLGIIGARARSARKLADGALAQRLADLEHELTTLYDEWTVYLRSMRSDGATVEPIPAGALLAEVVEAAAATTSVPVALAAPSGMPDLRGDRVLLREALLNIISNAAEACEGTAGRVDVRARVAGSAATPAIEIEIADTGPGIPRADLGRIFAPGFTTKASGSGIGLAIAERAVSAHYGQIRIDSEPGQGTRVIVALPCDLGGFAHLAAFGRGGEGP